MQRFTPFCTGRRSAARIGFAEQQGHRREPQVASAPQEKLNAGPAVVRHHQPRSAGRGAGQAGEKAVVRNLLRGPPQLAHLLALQEKPLLQPGAPKVALEAAQKRVHGFGKVGCRFKFLFVDKIRVEFTCGMVTGDVASQRPKCAPQQQAAVEGRACHPLEPRACPRPCKNDPAPHCA